MRAWIANTDFEWYRFLSGRPDLDEVNFWRPSDTAFKILSPGEPLLFRLKAPHNAIAGVGFRVRTRLSFIPISPPWDHRAIVRACVQSRPRAAVCSDIVPWVTESSVAWGPGPLGVEPPSVRARQLEHVLGDVVEDHLARNRRRAEETQPFPRVNDLVFLREAVPPEGFDRPVGRLDSQLGGQILPHLRIGPDDRRRVAAVERPRGPVRQQTHGVQLDTRLCQRMGEPLVGADRSVAEHPALPRVLRGAAQEVGDRTAGRGRRQEPPGIQT